MTPRLPYDDSLRRLHDLGLLDPDESPTIPDHLPQPDDDELGSSFFRTGLRGVDMRHSTFNRCTFDSAIMDGARLTRKQTTSLNLDDTQVAVIFWSKDNGPEPAGG